MRLTFIIPPEPTGEAPAERTAGCTRVVYPMPNIYEMTVMAWLEKHGHVVGYADFIDSGADIERFLSSDDSDVYFIWTVNLSRQADFAARDAILRIRPEARIVFLGPGATYFPKLYLTDCRAIIVRGEPELTALELVEKFASGEDWTNIDGITALIDGKVTANRPRALIKNLDILPFPARHLAPSSDFHNPKLKTGPYTTMATSRNCPFKCIYCVPSSLTFARELDFRANNNRKPPISFRSVEHVAREIDELAAQGYKAIGFVDDNFIWNEERTAGICNALKKHGIVWGCEARVDAITEPIARMLGNSGCMYVDLGVESFNDDILKFIKKGITSEQIFKAIALLKKHNVPVKLNILIGTSPLETKETLKDTLRKAKSLKVDQVMFNIVSPFPGTEFYHMAKENGWIKGGEYEPTNVQRNSILNYPHLSAAEMEHILYRFNLKFFLSPYVVWTHLRKFRSFSEFFHALKALRTKLFWK